MPSIKSNDFRRSRNLHSVRVNRHRSSEFRRMTMTGQKSFGPVPRLPESDLGPIISVLRSTFWLFSANCSWTKPNRFIGSFEVSEKSSKFDSRNLKFAFFWGDPRVRSGVVGEALNELEKHSGQNGGQKKIDSFLDEIFGSLQNAGSDSFSKNQFFDWKSEKFWGKKMFRI